MRVASSPGCERVGEITMIAIAGEPRATQPDQEAAPTDVAHGRDEISILVDCRWLGWGGAGRVTELLLAELRDAQPGGTWSLWGDPKLVTPFLFAGASIAPWSGSPRRWFGQGDLLRVPRNDFAVYLHQIRPFRLGRSITFVYDTIPVRFERRRTGRIARRFFFGLACRLSSRIITISAWSRDSITRDLAVPRSKISVITLAVDERRVRRIRAMRRSSIRRNDVVYIGRFAEHKNLQRLCSAFQSTAVHRQGGRLLLVGGSSDEVKAMSVWLNEQQYLDVQVRGICPEAELDEILATCQALVQPSLEEGFGLPAVEAAAVGVQVAASRTGFAPQIPAEMVTFLDPLDVRSIANAIDDAVARPDVETEWLPKSTLSEGLLRAIREVAG